MANCVGFKSGGTGYGILGAPSCVVLSALLCLYYEENCISGGFTMVKVALCQSDTVGTPEENVSLIARMVEQAVQEGGADIAVH